jgi:hypothetical protein
VTQGSGTAAARVAAIADNVAQKSGIDAARLAAIFGGVTQFIGATFLVVYRSTMLQASAFMTVLERINTVGMAVRELNRISDDRANLRDRARAHLVELLLSAGDVPGVKMIRKPVRREQKGTTVT